MFFKQFGGKAGRKEIARYSQSENWRDGRFQNLEETHMGMSAKDIPGALYKQLAQSKGRTPKNPLPIAAFELAQFLAPSEQAKMIWYGHSAVLMRLESQTILIDPMLGPDTTPIAPIASKRFSENSLDLISDFPEIDLMVITHDHYDHLDYASIQRLKPMTKKYFVALGVKRHLVCWGVDESLITEFDWWDQHQFENIEITFTPTRHFSGRGLTDRAKTLWGGWAFRGAKEHIWFSGDGGYGKHFKEVGKHLGPFDFAFMECGQYCVDWHPIHMFPHEAVQAALDAGVKKAMPVHWAGFALSYQHTWKEPAEEFVKAALKAELPIALPPIGFQFEKDTELRSHWWEEFE